MKKRTAVVSAIIVVVGLVMVGLFGRDAQAQEKTLKFGFANALTGPAADWMVPMQKSLQLEMEEINAKGGIKIGADKYKLKMVSEDTHCTSEGAKTAAEKLVYRDKVKLIFGAGVTHSSLGVQEVTFPNKVINVNSAFGKLTATGQPGQPPFKYTIKSFPGPHEVLRGLWKYTKQKYPQWKRVAIISPRTMSSDYSLEIDQQLLPSLGYEIVFVERFEIGMKDFYPILTKALAKKIDFIHPGDASPSSWALMIKQAREMGFKGGSLQEIPLMGQIFNIAGKENCEKLISYDYPTYGPNSTAEYRNHREKYEKKYRTWWPIAPNFVRVMFPLLQAMQIAETIDDTDKILEVFRSRPFKSFGQEGRAGGTQHYGFPAQWADPLIVSEIIGGKIKSTGVISVDDQVKDW